MKAKHSLVAVAWLVACGSSPKQPPMPLGDPAPFGATAPTNVAGSGAAPSAGSGTGGVGTPSIPGQPLATAGSAAMKPALTPPAGSAGTRMMSSGSAGMTAGVAGGAAGAAAPSDSLYDAATNTLRAPASGEGVQISTPMFDLQPGDEKFSCFHTEIPIDGEIDVHYWESVMAKGSHHFILYQTDNDTTPIGTMDGTGCLSSFQKWIYSSAQPHIDLKIPEGVAFTLGSRQRVVFDMHYINTTTSVLHAQVTLNVVLAKGTFQKATSLISYNQGIRIPPMGTQTVGGDCTPGNGAKFFYLLSHTHRRGKLATITRVLANGQMGEELLRSTDWELPQEKKYVTEPYLTFQPGEKFHYSCDYQNDLDQVVTSGPSANTNEMCMAITYYFPASAGGSCN